MRSALLRERVPAWRSTIAMKIGMALSGLIFVAYVIAHLYGNLKVYQGQDAFDTYTAHLRTLGEPILPYAGFLTLVRVALVAALVTHVTCAWILWRRARRARPVNYVARPKRSSSASARSMRWGGVTLLAFVLFHLANLTTHTIKTYPNTSSAYVRLIDTFQGTHWYVVAIYLLAQVPLGLHLHHGFFSAMQTLGYTGTARRRGFAKRVGATIAIVVPLGFASIPIAILIGVGHASQV